MQDRIDTLELISGLTVTHRQEKGQSVYEFFSEDGHSVKTCFTYDKAKLFAEGVKYGKTCREPWYEAIG